MDQNQNNHCRECPWRKKSAPGWVGTIPPEEWVKMAHGEARVDCHLRKNVQCVGLAIYRANVCKLPRDPVIRRKADRENVFSNPNDFIAHHRSGTCSSDP